MNSSLNDTDNQLLIKESNSNLCDINEKEIEYLINNYLSILNSKKNSFDPTFSQWRLSNKLRNETEQYKNFLDKLQQDFLHINSLISEANIISNEMEQKIIYNIILQIPISYLKPNERTINNLCELAIQIKRENSLVLQIWDIEKFEMKLNHMKNIYNKWIISENKIDLLKQELKRNNPFFDEQSQNFIGIANIYLKALFYNSKLDYIVPIINTQGERSGSVHVVLDQIGALSMKKSSDFHINSTTRGSTSEGISVDIDEQSLSNHSNSQHSFEDEGIDESSIPLNGKNEQITVKFSIKEIRDLPQSNIENIICRYTFINPKLDQTILSLKSSDNDNIEQKSRIFTFNHENEYTFPITDHFLSTCLESSISIEVWSQSNINFELINNTTTTENNRRNIQIEKLSKQWKDVKRHVQFSVEIHELDTLGQWGPVQVDIFDQIISGGVYRLKQGQSKRIVINLRILPRTDPMALVLNAIRSVEIGSIRTRKFDAPRQLDSYQDEELQHLRHDWLDLIEKRKIFLESQINILNQQTTNKTINDIQKENILLEQLICLAEERHIAIFPPSGTGIPGAPAAWNPPLTIELHRPIIYLNIDSINMNVSNDIAGIQAKLNEENETYMYQLPLIQHASNEIRAVAQWNPSIHESPAIDQVTSNDTLIYLIVKVIVIVSQPIQMELVLRKRIAVTISKTEGWWSGKTIKNLLGYKTYKQTSVVYEIISNIPKTIHNNETKIDNECLSEDSIKKYIQYASNIDSLLLLDYLRQEVLLAENSAKKQTIRKATSAPNIVPQKRKTNTYNSPINSRRDQISSIFDSNKPNETISILNQSELNSSTPSLKSRSLFIEEEQLQPIQTSPTFQIKHPIELDEIDKSIIAEKYSITSSNRSSSNEIHNDNNNNNDEDLSIDCRVIINTDHSIINKPGIIRYIGEIAVKKGIWYGIQLDEAVGKNNGSLNGHIYFKCEHDHGIFVRRDKIKLINK